MKRALIVIIMCGLITALPRTGFCRSGGPPDGKTGAPGEGTCHDCHSTFNLNSGQGSLAINGLPDQYQLGETYRLEVHLADPDARRWGFELTAKDANSHRAGTISLVNDSLTQLSGGAGNAPQYIKHTRPGTNAGQADGNTWELDWKAPDNDAGRVTWYVAGNAANNNNQNTGDHIYTHSEHRDAVPQPDEFTLSLVPGWNLVSSPVTPTITKLDSIFAAMIAEGNSPFARNADGLPYDPIDGVRDLHDWDFRAAYQIKVAHAADVTFTGAYTDTLTQYQLSAGWNWISYPSVHDSIFVTEAMAPLANELLLVKDNAGLIYAPEHGYNQLGYMKPGGAWMMTVALDTSFTWPKRQHAFDVPPAPPVTQHFAAPTNTGQNMHLFITGWDDISPQAGDEVAITYRNGEVDAICGVAVATAGLFPIVVWGDDNTTDAIEGPADNDPLSVTYWSAAADTEFALIPVEAPGDSAVTYQTNSFIPVRLYYQAPPNSLRDPMDAPGGFGLTAVYPNPFNARTVISYQLSVASGVSLALYDLSGREVRTLESGVQSAGHHQLALSAEDLTTGIYLVRLTAEGRTQTAKAVVMK